MFRVRPFADGRGSQGCRFAFPHFIGRSPASALHFLFTMTLERPDLVRPLTTMNKP